MPALQQIVTSSDNLLGRFHAMWTLEGLGALDAPLVREQMKDPNPRMRVQAIRASETLYKGGNKSFDADYKRLATDADADVAIQAMLTLNLFKDPAIAEIVKTAQAANPARGVKVIGDWITQPIAAGRGGAGRGGPALSPARAAAYAQGEAIFNETCFSCHGPDGRGQPMVGAAPDTLMAPPLGGSLRVQGHRDYVVKVLLHGLTGPMDETTYSQVMIPMGTNSNEWIAAIGSYVRNSFGNTGPFIMAADVARVRAMTSGRKTMWTVAELEASLPMMLHAEPTWKATASHNVAVAPAALTLSGWTTAAPQQPGMWIQVELPAAVSLAEVQFESPGGTNGFGIGSLGGGTGERGGGNSTTAQTGGGRGRGAGPADPNAPAPPPPGFYPRGYTVQVSTNGTQWSQPVAQGQAEPGLTIASFRPVSARFVRITATAAADQAWSMKNLRLSVAGK